MGPDDKKFGRDCLMYGFNGWISGARTENLAIKILIPRTFKRSQHTVPQTFAC